MKKIPLILTLVCTTLTWNHKAQAAENSGDSSSNPFLSSDDSSSSRARLAPERDHTPPPLLVVSQLERAASESWDAERERLSKSATSSPTKAGVSSAKKVGVPDDENVELQQFLMESITSSSPPKSQGVPTPINRKLLDEEAERQFQRDLDKATAKSMKAQSKIDTPLSVGSHSSSPKKERASSPLTGGSSGLSSALPTRVIEEKDDGLQEALRQIKELEAKEKAEKELKLAEERKLAEEKRRRHENEKETAKKQLDEIREKKSALQLQKDALHLQMEELEQLEDGLRTIYLDLLTGPKDKKTSASESSTTIKPRLVSSPEGGSSVGSSNGTVTPHLPSSVLGNPGSSSDSHSSDSSATGDDKK